MGRPTRPAQGGTARRRPPAGVDEPRDHLVDGAGLEAQVAVGHEDPVARESARAEVRRPPVAHVAARAHEGDLVALGSRPLGRAVGRPVVGQHHLVRQRAGPGQRVQEVSQHRPRRVGDDDDPDGGAHVRAARSYASRWRSAQARQVNRAARSSPATPSRARSTGSSSSRRKRLPDRSGVGLRVGHGVTTDLRDRQQPGRQHAAPAGHRLEHGQAEALAEARVRDNLGAAQIGRRSCSNGR